MENEVVRCDFYSDGRFLCSLYNLEYVAFLVNEWLKHNPGSVLSVVRVHDR